MSSAVTRREATLTLAAGAVGVLAGGLTALGQQWLPEPVRSVANSSGSWVLLAFVMAWWSRRLIVSVACGVLTLWSLLGGYVVASELRGYPASLALVAFWAVAGLLVGPAVGVGASWARRGGAVRAGAGVGLLAGVLIGESVYGLTVIAGTTSPVYWWLQAGVGVLLVVTNARSRPDPRTLASAVIVSTVVAAAFGMLYSAA